MSRSKAIPADPGALRRRDIEFTHHTVSVVKKLGEAGTSYFYLAKDDLSSSRKWRTGAIERSFIIKSRVVSTIDQAKRMEDEVRALRKLSSHPNLLHLIDSGFSSLEETPTSVEESEDDQKLETRRLYCLLLDYHPYITVKTLMEKYRRRLDKAQRSGRFLTGILRGSKTFGYMDVATVLGIFRQMALAVQVIHFGSSLPPSSGGDEAGTPKHGYIHMELKPELFFVQKCTNELSDCKYTVKLCGLGCAIDGRMSLQSDADRERATQVIESCTTLMYRAPEMIDLQKEKELTDRIDIWALGCCLYGLLFSRDCFSDHDRVTIVSGKFDIPDRHPYDHMVLELLGRMLTVDSQRRASIQEVIACVDALSAGKALPSRDEALCNSTEVCAIDSTEGSQPIQTDDSSISVTEEHSQGYLQSPRWSKALSLSAANVLSSSWTDEHADVDSNQSSDEAEVSQIPVILANCNIISSCPCPTKSQQWIEFQPNSKSGRNIRHRIEPVSPVGAAQSRSLRGGPTDPLNLGSLDMPTASSPKVERTETRLSEWTFGIIGQLSSRSLIPIDSDSSEVSVHEQNTRGPVLKPPSMRNMKVAKSASHRTLGSRGSSILEESDSKPKALSDFEYEKVGRLQGSSRRDNQCSTREAPSPIIASSVQNTAPSHLASEESDRLVVEMTSPFQRVDRSATHDGRVTELHGPFRSPGQAMARAKTSISHGSKGNYQIGRSSSKPLKSPQPTDRDVSRSGFGNNNAQREESMERQEKKKRNITEPDSPQPVSSPKRSLSKKLPLWNSLSARSQSDTS